MKKLFALLLVFMLACTASVSGLAEDLGPQIVDQGGRVFYDASGNKLTNATALGGNAVVEMSKTIAPYEEDGKRVENEFVVTLNVQTQQKLLEISSDTPDSAVMLVMDVSNSMDDCVICGNDGYHGNNSGHTYVSRLARTKEAAKEFIAEFANETGAQAGDKRMVGLVAYGTHAVNILGYGYNDSTNWVDVRTTAGMNAVINAIDNNLNVANSGYSKDGLNGGGTSIESGLKLASNILNAGVVNTDNQKGELIVYNETKNQYEPINYVYTILLTDGQPTYPAISGNNHGLDSTDVEYIQGDDSWYNSGNSTQYGDYNDVDGDDGKNLAAAIKNLNGNGMSKLYSICFGKVDGKPVWGLDVIGGQTIGTWLGNFSTKAYNAEEAQDANLFDAFNSVMTQIQLASKAWKVEDWMGPHMIMGSAVTEDLYNTEGGTLHNAIDLSPNAADYSKGDVPDFVWDILASEPDNSSDYDEDEKTGTLSYTYKYRVTLDNLPKDYTAGTPVKTNKKALLKYFVQEDDKPIDKILDAEFPEPQVMGLEGNLTFTKWLQTDGGGYNPGSGIWFKLSHIARPDVRTWTAEADENGLVTFENIPSGHDYVLTEMTVTPGYLFPGGVEVDVDFGESTTKINLDSQTHINLEDFLALDSENKYTEGQDGIVDLINTRITQDLANVTITKNFTGIDEDAARVVVRIYRPAYEGAHLDAVYDYHVLTPELNTWQFNIRPGYDYYLSETTEIPGWNHTDLTIEVKNANYNEVKNPNIPKNPSETVEFTRHIRFDATEGATVTLNLTNSYTRKTGALTIEKDIAFIGEQPVIPENLAFDVMAIEVADANGTELPGAEPHTLQIRYNATMGEYVGSLENLPTGYYKLAESGFSKINGYTHLGYTFMDENGKPLAANPVVQITDKATLKLSLTNSYEQDVGTLGVHKLFGGSLSREAAQEALRDEKQDDTYVLTDEDYARFLRDRLVDSNDNPISITINVYHAQNGGKGALFKKMSMNADTNWAAHLNVPVGEYWLEEEDIPGVENYKDPIVTWSSHNVKVTKGAESAATLTNTYEVSTGVLNVSKLFAPETMATQYFSDRKIYVYVLDNVANPTFANQRALLELSANTNPPWTASVELPVGNYLLYEQIDVNVENSAHVNGYTVVPSWTVNGVEQQKFNGVSVEIDDEQSNSINAVVTNTYTLNDGTLVLHKDFDQTGDLSKVPTAITFNIYEENHPETLITTVNLNQDNSWNKSVNLQPGTYFVEEVLSDDRPVVVDWTGDGVTGTTNNTARVQVSIGATTVNVLCDNDYQYTQNLTFTKLDKLTNLPIEDVEFTLAHACSEEACPGLPTQPVGTSGIVGVTTFSDEHGIVTFANLLVGHTYTLTESEFAGYLPNPPMTVTVTMNGATIDGTVDNVVYNVPTDWPYGSLSFTKHSSYTHAPLADVEFTLKHNDDCANCPGMPEGYDTELKVTTDETGVVDFSAIPAGHTFTLSETKVPEGYKTIADMTVTVAADGRVDVADAAGTSVYLEGIILYNDLIEWPTTTLSFTKLSSYDQSVVAGAQFDLVHDASCCLDEIDLAPATSDKYGEVTIANIPQNHNYTLKEIVTPDGYETMTNMLVQVLADGTILIGPDEEPVPEAGLIVYNDPTVIPTPYIFEATKTMDGETPKEHYTFLLSYEGEVIERVENDGSKITFAPLLFTQEGKETFTITEEVGDNAKVLYDKSVYTVTVTAKKGANDVLDFVVDIDKDGNTYTGDIEFHNETMKKLPETGDNSKLGLWLTILAMAAVGFVVLAKRKAVRS